MAQTDSCSTDFKGSYEIFQNKAFAELYARHHKLEVLDLGGLIVLMAKNFFGYTHGFLGCPEAHGTFEDWWEKLRALDFSFIDIHTTQEVSSWTDKRISPADNYNLFFDLAMGEEILWGKFSRSCRKAVRGAVNHGVYMREAETPADLKRYYEIVLKLSDGGRKFEIMSFDLIQDILKASWGKIFVTCFGEQIISGNLFLLTKSMSGWLGGIDRDYAHLSPGNLFLFETIKWGQRHGFRYLDMGQQSLTADPGNVYFKMSFGPLRRPAYLYRVPKNRLKIFVHSFKETVRKGLHRD